jgi:GNAT superfamily N-acetyltransferase
MTARSRKGRTRSSRASGRRETDQPERGGEEIVRTIETPAIRHAAPQDAEFLAWVILTASRGHLARGWFDIALHQPEERCVQFLTRLSTAAVPSWWHFSRFLVAEVESERVAALCAFSAAEAYPLSEAAMTEAAQAVGVSAPERAAIWQRGAYMFSCIMAADNDCWTLENIATVPQYRRRGLTTALIAKALEIGRDGGFAEAQITYLIGNDAAERAYQRSDFHFAGERRDPDFQAATGAPGLRRVVRTL